jgi:hypothetical protein
MTNSDITRLRLHNQCISHARFEHPGEVVAWFGAIQAQMYLDALWAIGLRLPRATEAAIEQAIADKTIVRTWPMRGTLHFVAAADARWMLKLLTPRIINGPASRMYQQLGLDQPVFVKAGKLFAKVLGGGRQLTREAMYAALESAGVSTAKMRGLHILSRLAQDGLICFGAREGRQPTFALLDEWAPASKNLGRDEALAEIARRYFTSHGPATLQDFAWWTGLTLSDARAGLDMVTSHLVKENFDGQVYWLSASFPASKAAAPTAFLLPAFDEYTVAYKDRGAVLEPLSGARMITASEILSPVMVVDGRVIGTWKRTLRKNGVVIRQSPLAKLIKPQTQALASAANRYAEFLETAILKK